MSFYATLMAETAAERATLLAQPLFADALAGRVTRPMYRAFLTEAYHHVRHTVPLMMAAGARLGRDAEWLRGKLVHYIEEEYGHHEWVLNDLRAAGGAEIVQHPFVVAVFLLDVVDQLAAQPFGITTEPGSGGHHQRHRVAHVVVGLGQEGAVHRPGHAAGQCIGEQRLGQQGRPFGGGFGHQGCVEAHGVSISSWSAARRAP